MALAEYMREAKLLIVDDELANVRLLEQTLQRWGYAHIHSTTDSRQAVALFTEVGPDLVLLDLMMPYLDGFEILNLLRGLIPPETVLPILVLTADITPQAKLKALSSGAKDFLTKPFDSAELLLRISNMLETRYLHQQLQNQNVILEEKVRERTAELQASQIEILERLAQAAEYRDDDTGQHTQRVGVVSAQIARGMGLSDERIDLLRRAAPLHDVGKIGISDAILLKPERLTKDEFEIMKTHTTIGSALLAEGRSDLVVLASSICVNHHERWEGGGYPNGIAGEEIPLEGRIVTVADVFDALTHERPYKKAWPVEEAVAEIAKQQGKQFDPAVIDSFMQLPHMNLI